MECRQIGRQEYGSVIILAYLLCLLFRVQLRGPFFFGYHDFSYEHPSVAPPGLDRFFAGPSAYALG